MSVVQSALKIQLIPRSKFTWQKYFVHCYSKVVHIPLRIISQVNPCSIVKFKFVIEIHQVIKRKYQKKTMFFPKRSKFITSFNIHYKFIYKRLCIISTLVLHESQICSLHTKTQPHTNSKSKCSPDH